MNQKPKHLQSLWNKKFILFCSFALILALGLGFTIAWLSGSAGPASYNMEGVHVSCKMVNDYYNPAVENQGNIESYIRVAMVVNYRKKPASGETEYGVLFPQKPVEGSDYKIAYNTSPYNQDDWLKGADGYYYYKYPVAPGGVTTQLINNVYDIYGTPDGYELRLEYLCEAVQAVPDGRAVIEAWGATLNGRNIESVTGIVQ